MQQLRREVTVTETTMARGEVEITESDLWAVACGESGGLSRRQG